MVTYKKLFFISFRFLLFTSLLCFIASKYESVLSRDLSRGVIRFHVRANSNSKEDQLLKYQVRNEVISYLRDLLQDTTSVENAVQIIISKKSDIEKTASKALRSKGCSYPISSRLAIEPFPDRMYGNFKFPKGSYTSYIIEIGSGKGHNWWCCLYPSLCFIDKSSASFSDSSTAKLKHSLSKKEFKYATSDHYVNSNYKSKSNSNCNVKSEVDFKSESNDRSDSKTKSGYNSVSNVKYRFKYLNKFREIKLFGKP